MKKHFNFEGRRYVLSFVKNQFVVYEELEFHHDRFYSWWDDEPSNHSKIKNPTKLVRKIWHTVRQYICRNKISYFEIVVSDPKRSRIYQKFLKTLNGYQCFEHGYSFTVVKMKGDI
jgi:hypothetical protein